MAFKDKVDSKETLMAYQFVTYEKRGRIAIVTFDRPERMNALHPPGGGLRMLDYVGPAENGSSGFIGGGNYDGGGNGSS